MASIIERTPARGPRPGTKIAQILPHLQEGRLGADIAPLFSVSRAYIGAVKSASIALGYLPESTELEKERARQEYGRRVSLVKGGVMLVIEPFVELDMLTVEIMKALPLKEKGAFSYEQINNAVGYLRRKNPTLRPNRTAEEWAQVNKQSKEPEETIAERVKLWLAIHDLLMEHKLADLPEGRNEWLFLITYLNSTQAVGKRNKNLYLPRNILDTLKNDQSVLLRLKPCIEIINEEVEREALKDTSAEVDSKKIDTRRFGTIVTGIEYAFSFYCVTHGREDEVRTALPHNIDPRKWAVFVDSKTTVRGCNEKCYKRLQSIEIPDILIKVSTLQQVSYRLTTI